MAPLNIFGLVYAGSLTLITGSILMSTCYSLLCSAKKIKISRTLLGIASIEYILWFLMGIFSLVYFWTLNPITRVVTNICTTLGGMTAYIFMVFRFWISFKGSIFAMKKIEISIHIMITILLFTLSICGIIFINIRYLLGLTLSGGLVGILLVVGSSLLTYKFNSNLFHLIKLNKLNDTVKDPLKRTSSKSIKFSKRDKNLINSISKQSLLATILLSVLFLSILLIILLIPIAVLVNNANLVIEAVRLTVIINALTIVITIYSGFSFNKNFYAIICKMCDIKFLQICELWTGKQIVKAQNNDLEQNVTDL